MKKIFLIAILSFSIIIYGCDGNGEGTNNNNQSNGNSQESAYEIQPQEGVTQIYYFWGDGCPACDTQNQIWEDLENNEDYKDKININKFETWGDRQNSRLMGEIGSQLGVRTTGVPLTIIGEESFVGVDKNNMIEKIDYCIEYECNDEVIDIINNFE
ncbi:hypothetical protein [Candidatus Absconditicoccus praedator]|uniref:hypothetical protein n=1 Tax=Candidatus Absconditicoccus praedator TaxID=2735562 RepID=UPI001E46240F|nr:hypothetical protein [Candidatus Absconditicoccus praedator]UFX83015.1 hypothetical protein HLG78_02670 [Candidatus Absconditicoccus praedator]